MLVHLFIKYGWKLIYSSVTVHKKNTIQVIWKSTWNIGIILFGPAPHSLH